MVLEVGHITCNNTQNNEMMLQEFAHCYLIKTGATFDVMRQHITYVPLLFHSYQPLFDLFMQMPCTYNKLGHAGSDICTQQVEVPQRYSRQLWTPRRPRSFQAWWNWHRLCHLCESSFVHLRASSLSHVSLTWDCRHTPQHNGKKPLRLFNTTTTCHQFSYSSTWRYLEFDLYHAHACHFTTRGKFASHYLVQLLQVPLCRQSMSLFWNLDSKKATPRSGRR